MSNTEFANVIAATVLAGGLTADAAVAMLPATEDKTDRMMAETVLLKAEQTRLKAAQPAANAQVTAVPAAPKAEYVPVLDAAYKPSPAKDKALLSLITRCIDPKTAEKYKGEGKAAGAMAVKVHSALKSAGLPVDSIIRSALDRNVISKMGIPTKNGMMMLYFDAALRPNTGITLTADEMKAFGK